MGPLGAEPPSPVIPILSYHDAPAAIDFLERAFNARRLVVITREDGTIGHSEIQLGPDLICVTTARPDRGWKSPQDLDGINQLLYITIDDVDAHCQQAQDAGAIIVMPPTTMDYGREYRAQDPEGHEWSFGTYAPQPQPRNDPNTTG